MFSTNVENLEFSLKLWSANSLCGGCVGEVECRPRSRKIPTLIPRSGCQLQDFHGQTNSARVPFPNRQILDSSKLKESADDKLGLDENGRNFSKQVENTVGEGEIARYEQFLLFPQCFQMSCAAGLVWERVKLYQLGRVENHRLGKS